MVSIDLARTTVSEEQAAVMYDQKHWWPGLPVNLNLTRTAADFYLFYAAGYSHPVLKPRVEEFALLIAKPLAIYLDAACGGEARHNRRGFKGLSKHAGRSIARRDWLEIRQVQGLAVLGELRDAFNKQSQWRGGGFGGPAWGKIADLLYRYLNADISPPLFIDQAFALYHNGGPVFNKLDGLWAYDGLIDVLNANLKGRYDLVKRHASPWAVEVFETWYGEEEPVVILGLVEARPTLKRVNWRPYDSSNPAVTGDWVKVKSTSRVKAAADGEFTVTHVEENTGETGKEGYVYIVVDGKTKHISPKNVLYAVASDNEGSIVERSYIN